MFNQKTEVTAAVERLHSLREALNIGKGDVLSWEQIERTLGTSHLTNESRHIVRRFRRDLQRDKGIVSRGSIERGGIWLLTDRDVAEVAPRDRQRRMRRQCNRALKEIDTIDAASLNDHMRRSLSVQRHNLKYQRLQIGRSYRDHEREVAKTQVNPRRNPPPVVAVEEATDK